MSAIHALMVLYPRILPKQTPDQEAGIFAARSPMILPIPIDNRSSATLQPNLLYGELASGSNAFQIEANKR
jgi:hypothetical protein